MSSPQLGGIRCSSGIQQSRMRACTEAALAFFVGFPFMTLFDIVPRPEPAQHPCHTECATWAHIGAFLTGSPGNHAQTLNPKQLQEVRLHRFLPNHAEDEATTATSRVFRT